jgi:hypothetical protein
MTESRKRPVMVGTYLPPPAHAELKRIAKTERRSISAFLALLIEKELERRRRRAAA